ncbi:hypothetical protein Tco_1184278, partial [Tanacetum coccineum]
FSGTGSLPSGCVDLTGDEDPTDEDGDIGMGDSTGVSASLGGEIFSGGKKCQESNIGDSDNTGDGGKIVGGAIGACGGIGYHNSEVMQYRLRSQDGDIGMGDSTGVSASLGGKIFSRGKKCRDSNIGDSDNTGDRSKIVGEAIRASDGIGKRASEAKRSLVKSSKKLEEVFPGEVRK